MLSTPSMADLLCSFGQTWIGRLINILSADPNTDKYSLLAAFDMIELAAGPEVLALAAAAVFMNRFMTFSVMIMTGDAHNARSCGAAQKMPHLLVGMGQVPQQIIPLPPFIPSGHGV